MLILIAGVLITATALLVVPVCVFAAECAMAARRPGAAIRGRELSGTPRRAAFAIVIPAHNEEGGIAATLEALASVGAPQGAVIVVADNCTDATAEVAARCGALALVRNDAERRGKGYALDFAVRHLRADPPEVVVFLDADCRLSNGALPLLVELACARRQPVQACYEMQEPSR